MTPSRRTTAPAFLDPALRQYILDHRLQGHSAKTLKSRREMLAMLARYLGKPLTDADEEDLLRWYYGLEGAATWTRITYGRTVRSYFKWAMRRRMIDFDPSLVLPIPRPPQPNPNPLTPDEVALALVNAEPRTRMFLLLAVGAGLRAIEISRMRREDLNLVGGTWVLTVPRGKGEKRRQIVVSPWLAEQIDGWKSTPGRMFNLTPAYISNQANTFLHSIGIVRTLHRGRARYATTFHDASSDLVALAAALGHSSLDTLLHYTEAAPDGSPAALAALDTLLRGEAA